jgi:fucose 4-O-acetylase-like acetyltransferase
MNGPPDGRTFWVDVAKTVGICLIVFSHAEQSGFTESFLWTFHVPLFFFVSGYLTRPRAAGEFLAGLARKLLLPYALIYVLTTLVTAVIRGDFDPHWLAGTLVGVLYGTHSYPLFVNAALWFLPSLMTVEILYVFGVRRFAPSYLLFLAISYLLYRRHELDLFLSIDLSLLGLNFYLAGVLARRFDLFRRIDGRRPRLGLVAVAAGACTAAAASVGNLWYAGDDYALSLGAGLAGIMMVVSASMLIASLLAGSGRARSFFAFVSSNTLTIFCFHVFSNPLATALLRPLALGPPLARGTAIALLSIALLVPLILLIRRFVPELIGMQRAARA